jgi:Ca2+ transporting ATPase
MVTGDNYMTARAIAKEAGLIDPDNKNSIVIEGVDFINKIGGVICKKCRTIVCDCPRDKKSADKAGKEMRVDTICN